MNLNIDLLKLSSHGRKGKKEKKSEESPRELWDTMKHNSTCIMRVLEGPKQVHLQKDFTEIHYNKTQYYILYIYFLYI